MTTEEAPRSLWVHDLGGPTETIHEQRGACGGDDQWTEFREVSALAPPTGAGEPTEPSAERIDSTERDVAGLTGTAAFSAGPAGFGVHGELPPLPEPVNKGSTGFGQLWRPLFNEDQMRSYARAVLGERTA